MRSCSHRLSLLIAPPSLIQTLTLQALCSALCSLQVPVPALVGLALGEWPQVGICAGWSTHPLPWEDTKNESKTATFLWVADWGGMTQEPVADIGFHHVAWKSKTGIFNKSRKWNRHQERKEEAGETLWHLISSQSLCAKPSHNPRVLWGNAVSFQSIFLLKPAGVAFCYLKPREAELPRV